MTWALRWDPGAWVLRLLEFGVCGTSENEEGAYIQAGANEIGYRFEIFTETPDGGHLGMNKKRIWGV